MPARRGRRRLVPRFPRRFVPSSIAATIAFGAIGTKSAGGTSTISVAYPTGITAGQFLLTARCSWRTAAECNPQAETGWTAGAGIEGGTGTDDHTSIARSDYATATGSESGSVTFDQAGTLPANSGALGQMLRYTPAGSGTVWSVATATGNDNAHGADRTVNASSSIAFAPGDMLIAIAAVDTDAALTITSPALTASGITFGTTTRRTSGAGVTTGTDGNVEVFDALVTAGTGTVAPTLAFTTATTQCGPVSFIRIRETAAATNLTVDDATQAQAADSPTLTQVHVLTVADAAQAQSTDAIALTQVHVLAVDDATQAQAADNVTISVVTDLVVADAAQDQLADSPTLTQVHVLAVDDATQAQSTDSIDLTQVHVLVVADAAQEQTADEVTLNVATNLVVDDAAQAQAADSPTLTQVHSLAVQDAAQAQAADEVTLTQVHVLTVADAAQAQTADNVVLTADGALVIADATQAQTADEVTLTQVHVLAVQDASQAHAADQVTLSVDAITLAVQDASQAQSADSPTLTQTHVLTVQDAAHVQSVDSPTLTQVHVITVQDALQAQTADNVELVDLSLGMIGQAYSYQPRSVGGAVQGGTAMVGAIT
jgi:hypothetical protein